MMKGKKRLGKGIEDIAHFFISRDPQAETDVPSPLSVEEKDSEKKNHRVIGVISQTPGIPGAFWACQLAHGLSDKGKKSLFVDIGSDFETLTSILSPVKIQPSLNELLNQSDKTITFESPDGYQVLSFQMRVRELYQFKAEERDILFQILCREEEESDVMLINIDHSLLESDIATFLKNLHEVVLVVSPDDLIGAYSMLKALFQARPEMVVRLLGSGSQDADRQNETEPLITASRQFLGKSPSLLGRLEGAHSLRGIRSLKGFFPSSTDEDHFKKRISDISAELLREDVGLENGNLFFERIQTQMDANRSEFLEGREN